MSRRKKTSKLISAFALAVLIAIAGSPFCFSRKKNTAGEMIRIGAGNVTHCPRSFALFRHFERRICSSAKNDTLYRIIVIAVTPADIPFRDSIAASLRGMLNDPRKNFKWEWSSNWTTTNDSDCCTIFNRPAVLNNFNPGNPCSNYIDGWVKCSSDTLQNNMQFFIAYKNSSDDAEVLFTHDSDHIDETRLADDKTWHSLLAPVCSPVQLATFPSSQSPEFGAIGIEPRTGFSIWALRSPRTGSPAALNDMKKQAALLSPFLVVFAAAGQCPDVQLKTAMSLCMKIFHGAATLLASSRFSDQRMNIALSGGSGFIALPENSVCDEQFLLQNTFAKFAGR